MPIISMFYGIIIRLYLLDNLHHKLPHIHAKYAEFEASIGIADGDVLAGELPASNCGWCRRGSSCTAMNWPPIGNWQPVAKCRIKSILCEVIPCTGMSKS